MPVIARAAEFEDVWTTVQSKVLCDRIGHLANRVPTYMAEIIEEHRSLVAALEKRDLRAAAAMRLHLKSVDHAIARLRPLHADYFVEE